MGKILYIKNVSFQNSAVCKVAPIKELKGAFGYTEAEYNAFSLAVQKGNVPYANTFDTLSVLNGEKVYGFRIKPKQSGIIPIYIGNVVNDTSAPTTVNFIENITVEDKDVGFIVDYIFNEPIVMGEGVKIFFNNPNGEGELTASWSYGNEVPYLNKGLCLLDSSLKWFILNGYSLGVDYLVQK